MKQTNQQIKQLPGRVEGRITNNLREKNSQMKNIIIISSVLFLFACGGGEKSVDALIEAGDVEALKAMKAEISASIRESESQLNKINTAIDEEAPEKRLPLVSVFQVEEQKFNHFIEIQGSVETDQNIVVYPEFLGKLLDFKVSMGDNVSKGQTVALIDDGGLRKQLAQQEQRAKLSKTMYEKRKRLWDQNIGSEVDFLTAETQYLADEDMVKQLQEQVAKAVVTAPFTGIIDETLADEGQLVSPGQTPLFRIVNLKDMYIQADVPEKYLSTVKKGRKVLIELPVLDTIVESKVGKVSNYISPDNRTFKVEIDVPNQDGAIKPNLTSKLMINDYINEKAMLIPQSIISENSEGKQYVYKAISNGSASKAKAKKAFITTGKKRGDKIEVTSGLQVNDAIILEGARVVKDDQEVQIIK